MNYGKYRARDGGGGLKKVVSVSLGSSKRDHSVKVQFLGEWFEITRRGTDGDFQRAVDLLRELDGQVDAIGLGGIDIYLRVRDRRFAIADGLKLMQVVEKTPVADGSGLKDTLEREAVYRLKEKGLLAPGLPVLMVCALDRFGMAEALVECGCDVTFGDLIFVAGMPYPVKTLVELEELAVKMLPQMAGLPFHLLYPTGEKQDTVDDKKAALFLPYYRDARVIAGDFHLIRRYLPPQRAGQLVLTNTTTREDVELLKERGAGILATTTPELEGRSFGTNVMEALFLAFLGKAWEDATREDYLDLMRRLEYQPRLTYFSA
ncbi:MAG TPA: quinate 5-dehydrogenase [Spirochaetia bacterium]|nr:quinate 5-dehydrogenase [Spirochaetia bacterium]